jgi:hypothetical protein
LFLDQDGIPTLVEVKRSSDTRIRREVIGQLLDYAANAIVYWPVERLQSAFESTVRDAGRDPEAQLEEFLAGHQTSSEYWQAVKTNLQAGRVRLLFVADLIPPELRRVVEFLNTQMDPAEVLAVEIRQFIGEGVRSLVPRVYGHTEQAQQRKNPGGVTGKQWTEQSFLESLSARKSDLDAQRARRFAEWARGRGARMTYGRGTTDGSMFAEFDAGGRSYFPVAIWTSGTVEAQFQHLRVRPPFDDEALREELRFRLNQIPGIALPEGSLTRRPSFPVEALRPEASMVTFLDTMHWFLGRVHRSEP